MTSEVTSSQSKTSDEQVSGSSIWIRGLYMLLFGLITRLTEVVIGVVMLIQFVLKAATNNTNANLTIFGQQLSQYMYEIIQFQTFNSEDKPFPFRTWPEAK
jgi:hypothetical protein